MSKTTMKAEKERHFFKSMFETKTMRHQKMTNLNVKHWEKLSRIEEESIINLYNALVLGKCSKIIDIQMIVTEAFPKFEETIGKEEFEKVKKFFGIFCKPKQKSVGEAEIKILISKLRTIDNAQYYITGYKELIKEMADKLLNSPEDMTDLVKAKLLRMFFVIFNNNEFFLEDYYSKTAQNGENILLFYGERKTLDNNKLLFTPEELFTIYDKKVKYSDGYFYDMLVMYFKRMYIEYQISKNKYKRELEEILKFSELKYDANTEQFISVNKSMHGTTFGEIRNLKKKIFEVRGVYPLEHFCSKKYCEENIDISDLYVIYKIFSTCSLKNVVKSKKRTYRTLSGSKYIDKIQYDYEILTNFSVADDAEIERFIALFEYLATYDIVVKTQADGNGRILSNVEYYNAGALASAINYAMKVGYLDSNTKASRDLEVAKKMLALEGAEEQFIKFKKEEVDIEDMKELLGIDEEFEKNVLQINNDIQDKPVNLIVQTLIKLVLNNGVNSEADIDLNLIENVFIPGNEEKIKMFANGEISERTFKREIGFEDEFAEAYFDTSKIDISIIEIKLQNIKKHRKKDQIRRSKLIIALYCYVVKSGVACGPKHKPAKRNKGLKPEILENLIAQL